MSASILTPDSANAEPAMALDISSDSVAYINGSVYTINSSMPWASGFIVSPKGLFTHVGNTSEILSIAKQAHLITVDLKGNFTMPGIHDAHMHVMASGLGLTSYANIPTTVTYHDIADKVKEGSCACEYARVNQDWILAGAYSNQGFPNMRADRKYLDEKFPNTPVMIQGGAGHSLLLNTEALKRAGYDVQNEPDTQGAKFFRRADGSLTGEVGEIAMNKAMTTAPAPGVAHIKRVLKNAISVAHRCGVTSTQEASSNTLLLRTLREMDKEGTLNIDIQTHIVHGPEWIGSEKRETLHALIDSAETYKSKHVDTRFVKIILDGVPLPPLLTHATLDANGTVDHRNIQVPDIAEALQKYDARGMTVKVHCTGHGATRMALDAIEAARKLNPNGPRHEIAHNNGVDDADYKRYKELNVTAEMSPAAFFVHPLTSGNKDIMDWNFTKMMENDAFMTIGSDWGATPDPSLFNPLANIVETVGKGSKEKGGAELCKMLTINGAIAVGKDKEAGSIEVGKKANFIVLDKDLSKGDFNNTKVLRTYFEGEKVFDIAFSHSPNF